jgi:hypothetical protein
MGTRTADARASVTARPFEACHRPAGNSTAIANNVLDRQFQADTPSQRRVADFT